MRLPITETNVQAFSISSREVVVAAVAAGAVEAPVLVDRWPSHHLRHHLVARATLIAVLDPFLTPFQSVSYFPSLLIHSNRRERVAPATAFRCRMQQRRRRRHLLRRVDPVGKNAAVAVPPFAALVISLLLLTYPRWIRNTTQNVSGAWAATNPSTTPLPLRTL